MTALDVRVFDKTGQTLTGWIVNPLATSFSEEFNGNGQGELTVLLDSPDAALLRKDSVVRVYYREACVFAWFVETLERTIVGSDERRILRVTGRGLTAWVDDAVVYPQTGLAANYGSPSRLFNFASQDGNWIKSAGYVKPVGVKWKDDTSVRQGFPKGWPNPNAQWLWATDPTKVVKAGATNWFRSTFTLDKPTRVKFHMSADNRYEVFLDGAPLFTATSGKTQDVTWSTMLAKTITVPAGKHVVAAKVQNEKPWSQDGVSVGTDGWFDLDEEAPFNKGDAIRVDGAGDKSGLNDGAYVIVATDKSKGVQLSKTAGGSPIKPSKKTNVDLSAPKDSTAGFILTASALNDKGRPVQIVEQTSEAGWLVASQEPEWFPAEILWTLIAEAQRRGVSRLDQFKKGWTFDTDSNGEKWATAADATFPVGTPLSEVADFGVNLGVDYWLDPESLVFKAAERRGKDLSNVVNLRLGYNLIQFVTTEERTLKTAALVRTKDGWTEKRWMDSFYGRRETFFTVERTRSKDTGRKIAERRLRSLGRRRVVAQSVQAQPQPGAVPYVDFNVGDIVTVPSVMGFLDRTNRARVLSLAMESRDEGATYSVELEVLDVEQD